MLEQMTFEDLPNVTFSPESEVGVLPLNLPTGTKTSRSGRAPAHVHRSVPQGKSKNVLSAEENQSRIRLRLESLFASSVDMNGLPTKDTYGLSSVASSVSAVLQSFLANRLQALMGAHGSLEYALTWKEWAMPLGGAICALRASTRRISDKDFSGEPFGWPTMQVTQGPNMSENRGADHGGKRTRNTPQSVEPLIVGYPTPKTPTGGANSKRKERKAGGPNLQEIVYQVGWGTPRVTTNGGFPTDKTGRGARLEDQAIISGYPTCSSWDYKDTPGMAVKAINPDGTIRNRADQLPRLVYQVFLHGLTSDSSSAGTTKYAGYRLNPYFSGWLMGFPKEWTKAGIAAHLTRKKVSRSARKKKSKVQPCSSKDMETP